MRTFPASSLNEVWLRESLMLSRHMNQPVTQRLALIVGIAAFVVIAFNVSFTSMWDLWQTSDHRHGLLVFPISAFLIWRLRHQLVDLPVAIEARGLLLVVPLALGWVLARLAGVQVAEHFFVLAMIPAAVITLAGPTLTHKVLFPLLFLMLAIPLGDALVPHLMIITADLSTGLLKLSGFPTFRNGQYISLPGGEFVVADVCAGLRYLVAGVMISLLYGYLTYTGIRKRLVMVVAAGVTLIVANGVRAYIVMAVASATNMGVFGGRDHIYFGWLMFGVVMMLIMGIGARYADEDNLDLTGDSEAIVIQSPRSVLPIIGALGLVMLAITAKQLQADFVGETGAMIVVVAAIFAFVFLLARHKKIDSNSDSNHAESPAYRFEWRRALVAAATLAILITTPRFAASVQDNAIVIVDDLDIQSLVPCALLGPWQKNWQPHFQNPDLERSATFRCSDGQVSVYVAAYASALQGQELVSSSHHVVPPEWDRISKLSSQAIRGRDGRDIRVSEILVDDSAYSALIWHWYEIDGRVATGSLMTKAYQVLALLRGRPAGGRVVVIESLADGDFQQTRDRLEPFVAAIIGADPQAQAANPL